MSRGPDPFLMWEAPKIAPRLSAPACFSCGDSLNALSNDFLRSAKHRTMPGVKLATPDKLVLEFTGKPRPLPRISASAKRYFDNGWDADDYGSDGSEGSAGSGGEEGEESGPRAATAAEDAEMYARLFAARLEARHTCFNRSRSAVLFHYTVGTRVNPRRIARYFQRTESLVYPRNSDTGKCEPAPRRKNRGAVWTPVRVN